MQQPWRIIRTQSILKDRWIDLRADHCLTPGGVEISPYYVLGYPDWVNVVALTPDRRMVVIRQYRHAVSEVFNELPGGAVDPGDATLAAAAQRELEEESGFTARRWQLVCSLFPNPATQANRVHTYLALDAVRDREQRLDAGEEGLEVLTLPLDEVFAGLPLGLLRQSMQVSAVLLAFATLGLLRFDPGPFEPAGSDPGGRSSG